MSVDNSLYDTQAETWWDENGFLSIIRSLLNPARFGYFRDTLVDRLGVSPRGLRVLDVGCGGGLLAEEFARLGCRVAGIDPSSRSIAVADAHAAGQRLPIDYCVGTGESLPFADESFDLAYCCDVLEHVADLDVVISETARVLKPGGLYFYDTVNRTRTSRLVLIKLFQEWQWSSFMAPDTHDWEMFITPRELHTNMAWHGLANKDIVGLTTRRNVLRLIWALRQRKRGKISYGEMGRRLQVVRSRNTNAMYIGYAVKNGTRA
jgi:2-polyprenyl-6-hydroxyphenyl methylase/3-demethylubiquinone-9 3-methyltransferase